MTGYLARWQPLTTAQIYDPPSIPPLVATVRQVLARDARARALVSATVRNEATLGLFEETCRRCSRCSGGRGRG